jgi:transposase
MRLLPQSNPSPREGATAEITTMSPASSFAMSFLSWSRAAVARLIFSQKIASHSAGFWRLSQSSVMEAFFQLLAETSPTAHLVQMLGSTVVRAHVSAAGAKGGQQNQALGQSRGTFSSKIHLKTDFDGLPIAFHLTGGEVSDRTQLATSLDIGPDITPRAAMTDKGCDSNSNRAACRERHIIPVIPHRANTKNRPSFFPKRALRENRPEFRRSRRVRWWADLGYIRPQSPVLPIPHGDLGRSGGDGGGAGRASGEGWLGQVTARSTL